MSKPDLIDAPAMSKAFRWGAPLRTAPLRTALLCTAVLSAALLAGACAVEQSASGDGGGSASSSGQGTGGLSGSGGAGGAPTPACDPYVPRDTAPEMLIGPSNLQSSLLALMDEAQSELSLMMYQLSVSALIDGLIAAHQRGVNVRVSLDYNQSSNDSAIAQLEAAGVVVRAAPAQFNHAHAKVMIIDGVKALVMSANMNSYSMYSERNYGVIDRDAQDIEDLEAIFARDWDGQGTVDLSCTRLIVAPENAREHLVQFVAGAQQSLDLAVMYLSDNEMEATVLARAAAGIPVRVLFANPEWIDSNPATAATLQAAGIETKYLYEYELHAKLVIADGVPFIGSENLSFNSLNNNREIGLLVTEPEPAALVVQQFESDWNAGVPAP